MNFCHGNIVSRKYLRYFLNNDCIISPNQLQHSLMQKRHKKHTTLTFTKQYIFLSWKYFIRKTFKRFFE